MFPDAKSSWEGVDVSLIMVHSRNDINATSTKAIKMLS